ncbi:unnamed protein product [Symbiodinium natans]|uniref:Uncharacterized protein n=1 Tax=Symbiodinium natans TaxID=878477 RepID=A0A812U789_9DINO|nr:unnamed protein product [Symbiodinium natans]
MVLELLRWIRRHLSLGALRERLLPGAASAEADVEMTAADTPVRLPGQLALSPHVTVIPQRLRDFLTAALIAALLFFSTVFLSIFVIMEWASRPDQRGWLLLGFGFYIVSAMQRLWSTMVPLFRSVMSIRVEIRRFASATLFEAVTDFLAKEAERQGLTCSWDQEALQEHDKLTGKIQVKLRFWSSQARTMRISVRIPSDLESPDPEPPESLDMKVEFLPGDDIVCGRDARLERREILILNVYSNEKRALADKRLLVRWLEHAYVQFVKPIQDVVNVYSLQESSADWVPEWKFERVKTCASDAALNSLPPGYGQSRVPLKYGIHVQVCVTDPMHQDPERMVH